MTRIFNQNHRRILEEISPWLFQGEFLARWSNCHKKITMHCPYCQIETVSGKRPASHDRPAALLLAIHDGWDCWTFNCLHCKTKKRLDAFVTDFPELLKTHRPAGAVTGISSISTSSLRSDVNNTEYRIVKIPPVSPQVQAGQGGCRITK
jgi:hypothetical protein